MGEIGVETATCDQCQYGWQEIRLRSRRPFSPTPLSWRSSYELDAQDAMVYVLDLGEESTLSAEAELHDSLRFMTSSFAKLY